MLPRGVFAALRRHVETLHGRPFDDVMAHIADKLPQFSQHGAFGNYLYHFGLVGLDGSAAAGGLTGIHFVQVSEAAVDE